MMNMAHCRFHNTLVALRECYEHMADDNLSPEEQKSQTKLIALCGRIADDYGVEQ